MNRIHILSNRLPFNAEKVDNDFELTPSVGGLATGMKSIYKNYKGNWIGWPGLPIEQFEADDEQKIDRALEKEGCVTVHLHQKEINKYYEGFSNKTIWPLFHYFNEFVQYEHEEWEAYVQVNQKFADAALRVLEENDMIWVHDYQLMLVPGMIKKMRPDVTIGFFLHIPFPSFEVFRILPWRKEIISGMLGADLLGFHTYDYERHFLSSVRRLLGLEINFNQIHTENRIILADAFPMGIDYSKFSKASINVKNKLIQEKSELQVELERYFLNAPQRKLILSIDRMDYTKGIPNRLKAFAMFLEKYPQYRGNVSLVMLAVPSRGKVEQYKKLKKQVDELVGYINGRFGMVNYNPIWYFYRSLPFENLIELYNACDVALITPVRDGMNLVAKEYVASRVNKSGVIIISEMAGVSKEMGEAIIINPNNFNEIAESIYNALEMPLAEQRERMEIMQKRLKRYDVFKWAGEFVKSMEKIKTIQHQFNTKKITARVQQDIAQEYAKAEKRAIFLDYDGTLASFKTNPQAASPDVEVHQLIKKLTGDERNEVTIISGRDRATLEKWFEGHDINLIVEHGVWTKVRGDEWRMLYQINADWKENIRPALENFVDRTPGSFIEEKNYSLVWHYRKSEPEQGALRANELKDELTNLIANHNLEIMEGNKVIEVKSGGINKGAAAVRFIGDRRFDFILAVGDDWTDEYMFRELPENAVTVKVGMVNTAARFKVESVAGVRSLLKALTQ
ncbi:bifunctional alpha,alpha-trehalose-phosphate synthase (UDP-forming)/trehalose-phosphatase [Roseimarinus sediminis]|uniref:bifunctional alpha,alpha-trehalose-phosphate synthase (UDP-forming)/trehalose-phosphatase n=1 Tax=Roseimarinus sediminis TaxID=1610899 RepID=UPI003D1D490B